MNKQRVQFRRSREFGDFISDIIDVIKQNIQPFLRIILIYGLAPLFIGLIFGLLLNMMGSSGNPSDFISGLGGLGMIAIILGYAVGVYLVMGACYAFLGGLAEGLTKEQAVVELSNSVTTNAAKLFMFSLLISLVVVPLALVMFVLGLSQSIALMASAGVVLVLLLCFYGVKIVMAPYLITRPQFGFGDAIRESLRLTDDRWWLTFGLYLVVSIIATFVVFILQIPGYVLLAVNSIFAISEGASNSLTNTFIFSNFLNYAASYLRIVISSVFIVLLYYSWHEEYYGESIAEDIDNLQNWKNTMFENDGEL